MKKLFFMDIDGTLALGDELFDGTLELLSMIKERGGFCCYMTNNSSRGVHEYIKRFSNWGIDTVEQEFLTAGIYGAKKVKQMMGDRKVFLIGSRGYRAECEKAGLVITEEVEDDVAAVLTAFDTELHYQKLANACELLCTRDIPWYATNPDLCCPAPFGMIPDCGSICQMIINSTGKQPEYLGKPNPAMIFDLMEETGFPKEESIVIGDRLYTDIASGVNAGIDTCLVLTGEETEFNSDVTWCFPSVRELVDAMKAGEL